MLDVTYKSREFTEIEEYLLTLSADIIAMKNVPDGTEITVNGILEFHDDNDGKREPVDVMSIITPDNEVFAFQSITLKRTIKQLYSLYKGKPFTIKKISGTTKAGRKYINAALLVTNR